MKTPINYLSRIVLLSGIILLTATACQKDEEADSQPDYTATVTASEAESVLQDALLSADDAFDGTDDGVPNGKTAACATVTHNEVTQTVVINYGTGCTGVGGRTRTGKITVIYEGTRAVSSKRTITFENYSLQSGANSYMLSGTCIGSFSYNSTGYTYSVSASNLSLKLSGGENFSINSLNRTLVFNWGNDKRNPAGYTTTITGSSSNTDQNGKVTAVTIDAANPVVIKGSCTNAGIYYPASGNYNVVEGLFSYTVSWGTGACDKDIQIVIGGQTVTRTLP